MKSVSRSIENLLSKIHIMGESISNVTQNNVFFFLISMYTYNPVY